MHDIATKSKASWSSLSGTSHGLYACFTLVQHTTGRYKLWKVGSTFLIATTGGRLLIVLLLLPMRR